MSLIPQSNKRLLLVDGNSIINRSYFALAGRGNLTAPDGTPTGALNTYLNTFYKHLEDVKPTHICTLFDRREKTFRHEMYDGYKAKRKGMPDDLAVQMPLLKETLDAMHVTRMELAGYEADDLIGTLARQGEINGFSVYILSGDKDDFQLIDKNTVVLMPINKMGKTSTEVYDADALMERYGLTPEEFLTLKSIMGDPSDNIPGVRGIGEKGAIDLVKKYATLDSIYEHILELPAGIQKKLSENKEMAYLSYDLSKIDCNVPMSAILDELTYEQPDKEKLAALFYRLGFRSQIKKWNLEDISSLDFVPGDSQNDGAESTTQGSMGSDSDDVFKIPLTLPEIKVDVSLVEFSKIMMTRMDRDKKDFCLSIDIPMPQTLTDTDSTDGYLGNLTVCIGTDLIFSFGSDSIRMVLEYLVRQGIGKKSNELLPVGHSIKARFRSLSFLMPFASCFDVEIAGYILNQIEGGSPPFEMLYEHAVGESFPRFASYKGPDLTQTNSLSNPLDALIAQSEGSPALAFQAEAYNRQKREESAWRALLCRKIAFYQRRQIAEMSIETLIYDIEMPLVLHLDYMERNGVLVDRSTLANIHVSFESELNRLSASIYEKADMTFNILSPKQIGQVLFEKLKLPSGRKNSSGTYSTDSDELTRLIDEHPVVRDILNYRQISKLDSTFVLGLQKVIDPSDGRVHSSFSQAMTNTGRLSSADPNLQNIPIRSDLGSQIRKAFIAPPGRVLLDADYSQIELRLLAHLSGDENMMNAFLRNEDIHTNTAANIFGVPKEMVQPSMRSAAKTVNFSIVYGISDFGLSADLGVSFQEAHHYIEHYYAQYPMIRAYLDSLKQMGYDKGYVETMFGRRRVVRELTSPNRNIRNFGERAAMNTPVQGTAADIIKIAMNRVSEGLVKEKLDAVLILQVHDELIVECREDQAKAASAVLKEAMEGAAVLKVPLIAEVSQGQSWYDCKMG